MALNTPLEYLIPSAKADILSVLMRTTQPLSGRTIAALTGTVSQPTTSRILIELGRRGVVSKVPGGYELNRDHVSYAAIEALLGAGDELKRRVALQVTEWSVPPLSVVLFGSTARREESLDSDVDLLVVRPTTVPVDSPGWATDVANLSERVSRWCGSPCEVLEYSLDELTELMLANDPLIASLICDGIVFAGVHLDTLLGLTTR